MKDILSIEMGLEQEMQAVGDSQSLYFTPSGTPMRDVAADNVAKEDGKVVSPRRLVVFSLQIGNSGYES